MILDCVLTSVNENPLYLDFIPLFIKTWNKLYPLVEIKIILIAKMIPKEYLPYKDNLILFEPLENVSTSFISQYIRLLYPSILNYKNGIMITDIDIIPMNKTYYTNNIEPYSNDKFIYYRDNICFEYNQIAMCYNIALPKVWSSIFKIKSKEDIKERLITKYQSIHYKEGHGNTGWCTDQLDLYQNVMDWNKKTNNFIQLKEIETEFCRLDRHCFILNHILEDNIKNGKYTDYHCYRPYKKYKLINDKIYELL